MNRPRRPIAALALLSVTALTAAGCGGEQTDVSEGIDSYNERLTQQGIQAEFQCPEKVDGHEGTEFECTLKADQGDKSAKVKFEVRKEGEELIVIEKDQAAIDRALQTVVGAQQQQQEQQQPQQGGQAPQQPQQPQQPAPQQPEQPQQPQQPTP
jgi:hypothetical protein